MEFVTAELTPWHWLTIGVLFFAIVLFAPTTFLLWPAIAAIVTGLIAWLLPVLGWQWQIALFAVLSIVTILVGRHYFKYLTPKHSRYQNLNRRAEALVGRVITTTEPIVNGVGSATIDNTHWRIVGPDTDAGSKLLVTGTDGSSLTVKVIDTHIQSTQSSESRDDL